MFSCSSNSKYQLEDEDDVASANLCFRIREDFVRLRDEHELLVGIRIIAIRVRVRLERHLAVSL